MDPSVSRSALLPLVAAAGLALIGLASGVWGAASALDAHLTLSDARPLTGAECFELSIAEPGRYTALSATNTAPELHLFDSARQLDVAPTPFGPHSDLHHGGQTLTPVATWDLTTPGEYELSDATTEVWLLADVEALSNQLTQARAVGFGGLALFGVAMLLGALVVVYGRSGDRKPRPRRRRRSTRQPRGGIVALPYDVVAERARSEASEVLVFPSSATQAADETPPVFVQEWEGPSFDEAA